MLSKIAERVQSPIFLLNRKREIFGMAEFSGCDCSQVHRNSFSSTLVFDQTKCTSNGCFRSGNLVQSAIRLDERNFGTVVSCISKSGCDALVKRAVQIIGLFIERAAYSKLAIENLLRDLPDLNGEVNALELIKDDLEVVFDPGKMYRQILNMAIKLFDVEKHR